jgi:hypothetical protein
MTITHDHCGRTVPGKGKRQFGFRQEFEDAEENNTIEHAFRKRVRVNVDVPHFRRPLMDVGWNITASGGKVMPQCHMRTTSNIKNDGAGRDEPSGLRRSSLPVVGVGLSITPVVPRSNSNQPAA